MHTPKPSWQSLRFISFIGSYLPRRCGIATFTGDLADGIAKAAPHADVRSVAMNDRPEGYRYPARVWFEINQNRQGEYRLAADFLNMSKVDVCCLQHEFGLFGGPSGRYILDLLRRLRMPIVATLHTVLKEPNEDQLEVTRQLGTVCDRFVVMAARAYEFLTQIYDIPEHKIKLIPHGIPDVPFVDPNFYKDQFGVEGKKVILTFGLLSPNKGIENMIEAMPRIVDRHPDAVYIVLGATHPGVVAHSGEDYRLGLKRRVEELGIADHVQFVNKFVELDELVEFLGAADVYVTPYLNEAQITSGTLAYALGTGKATVSTPYWHAEELLAEGRGKLVPFADPKSLAAAVNYLFDHETERHAIRKRAYQYTRPMRWSEVAGQYLDLFAEVRAERNRNPKPVETQSRKLLDPPHDLTEIKLDHLLTLTDDVGILQHAKSTIPDRHHGYATADNARALVAVMMAQDHLDYAAGGNVEPLQAKYLSFLEHAFDPETERFRSRMSYDRRWLPGDLSDEVHAQAIWALGEAVARCQSPGPMTLAADLFHRALPACESFENPFAWADALIGIHAYLRRYSGDSHARRVREHIAEKLFHRFRDSTSMEWTYPIDRLTTASARLPHALLLSGRWMFRNDMIESALYSLQWLHHVQTDEEGRFSPVGDEGGFPRGGQKARFNQRPLEAAVTIEAYLEAYHVTGEQHWVDRADKCLNWFLGENDLRAPVYDHRSGGCHDALMPHGVNENQGAEATLCWLTSLLSMYELAISEPSEAVTPASETAATPEQPERIPPATGKPHAHKDNPAGATT
ncbi:MAG: glycosyltransferase family 4 protein [Phycisphaeraceae bacterium]